MAVRIAIVEDEKTAARALEQAIQRYGTENKVSFTIRVWHDPLLFLEEYQAEYDIVYMDIRMPALSGMETARNLRKMDRMVMLMLKKDSIRDVIAFPKVQNAGEPMSGAPDVVDEQQLKDLSIALTLKD